MRGVEGKVEGGFKGETILDKKASSMWQPNCHLAQRSRSLSLNLELKLLKTNGNGLLCASTFVRCFRSFKKKKRPWQL
jgi:hypothetical protein